MEAFAEHELVFIEAHWNGSCNESKTDILAGAADIYIKVPTADWFYTCGSRDLVA